MGKSGEKQLGLILQYIGVRMHACEATSLSVLNLTMDFQK